MWDAIIVNIRFLCIIIEDTLKLKESSLRRHAMGSLFGNGSQEPHGTLFFTIRMFILGR
jgi:hypothetical protein